MLHTSDWKFEGSYRLEGLRIKGTIMIKLTLKK
jgi:hypothetical protein